MGQHEVLRLLEKKGCWICADEISKCLGVSGGVVRRALMVLYEHGEVFRKESRTLNHNKYLYKCK